MNENAEKWAQALVSGDYKQCTGVLHATKEAVIGGRAYEAGYCCLGVACDLYQKEVGDLEVTVENSQGRPRVAYNGQEQQLPLKVQVWLGLKNATGKYKDVSLAEHNDRGASFDFVAGVIVAEPEGLF